MTEFSFQRGFSFESVTMISNQVTLQLEIVATGTSKLTLTAKANL